MPIKMKNLPVTERPYEKLEQYGEKNLTNAELLAIIIKSGTREETSVQLAQKILLLNENQDKNNLNFLREIRENKNLIHSDRWSLCYNYLAEHYPAATGSIITGLAYYLED